MVMALKKETVHKILAAVATVLVTVIAVAAFIDIFEEGIGKASTTCTDGFGYKVRTFEERGYRTGLKTSIPCELIGEAK